MLWVAGCSEGSDMFFREIYGDTLGVCLCFE
jgi:hypothetical protein